MIDPLIKQLAAARKDQGLTGRAVARAAQLSHGHFSEAERGMHSISLANLRRWAAVLGYDVTLTATPAAEQPEHQFDPSSVRDTTVTPYAMFEEGDDPYCVCGGAWLGDDGCQTQQPGWTPPPPYDGPSIDELLPAEQPGELLPAEQPGDDRGQR